MLAGAMAAAVCVISANKGIHEGLSALLVKQERVEGEALERWLQHVVVSTVKITAAVLHLLHGNSLGIVETWKGPGVSVAITANEVLLVCRPGLQPPPTTGCPIRTMGHKHGICGLSYN
jgi:hypothetical protein